MVLRIKDRRRPAACGNSADRVTSVRRFAVFAIFACLASAACSVPSLETPACTEARNTIREFYSIHFGNEMRFSPEGYKVREKFLTPEFRQKISSSPENSDPLTTGNEDIPKAFRIGECREISPEHTQFDVLLFWRDDNRSEQRMIRLDAVDRNDVWLVNDISR